MKLLLNLYILVQKLLYDIAVGHQFDSIIFEVGIDSFESGGTAVAGCKDGSASCKIKEFPIYYSTVKWGIQIVWFCKVSPEKAIPVASCLLHNFLNYNYGLSKVLKTNS